MLGIPLILAAFAWAALLPASGPCVSWSHSVLCLSSFFGQWASQGLLQRYREKSETHWAFQTLKEGLSLLPIYFCLDKSHGQAQSQGARRDALSTVRSWQKRGGREIALKNWDPTANRETSSSQFPRIFLDLPLKAPHSKKPTPVPKNLGQLITLTNYTPQYILSYKQVDNCMMWDLVAFKIFSHPL